MRVTIYENIIYSPTDLVCIPTVLLIRCVTLVKILNCLILSQVHCLKTTLNGFFPLKLNETVSCT